MWGGGWAGKGGEGKGHVNGLCSAVDIIRKWGYDGAPLVLSGRTEGMTGTEIATTHIGHNRGHFGDVVWFGQCSCFHL